MPSNIRAFDVVIVGNGAIGLASAFALADGRRDLSIGVIGPKSRPGGASVAAGAMLGCHSEITAHGLSTEHGRKKFELQRRAKALWPEWVSRLRAHGPIPPMIEGTFVFINARSGDIEDENFSAILEQLSIDGVSHQRVEGRDVPGLRPTMDARPFQALHIPSESALNAFEYIGALERIVAELPSVTLLDDRVVSLRLKNDDSMAGVLTASGSEIDAKQVLLAAGVGCQTLIENCPPLTSRLPKIFSGVGSSIVAGQPPEPFRHVVRTPNRAFACGLHVVPRGEQVYIGATNTIREAQEMAPRLVDMQFLLDSVIPQISEPLHASSMISSMTGCRPVASDGFPLIGKTSVEGLFIVTGTFRDGIQLSPLLAHHMADLLMGGSGLIENIFVPERQPLWTLNIDKAVTLCVRHYLSVYYENGCQLPKVGWQEFLLDLLEKEVRDIFSECGEEHVPPIDFIHLLRDRKKSKIASQL